MGCSLARLAAMPSPPLGLITPDLAPPCRSKSHPLQVAPVLRSLLTSYPPVSLSSCLSVSWCSCTARAMASCCTDSHSRVLSTMSCVGTCACMWVCVCVCVGACVWVCVCVCACVEEHKERNTQRVCACARMHACMRLCKKITGERVWGKCVCVLPAAAVPCGAMRSP